LQLQRLPALAFIILTIAAAGTTLVGSAIIGLVLVTLGLIIYAIGSLWLMSKDSPPENRQAFFQGLLRWRLLAIGLGIAVGAVGLALRARLGFAGLAAVALVGVGGLVFVLRRYVRDPA
jgi:hypothetical protein